MPLQVCYVQASGLAAVLAVVPQGGETEDQAAARTKSQYPGSEVVSTALVAALRVAEGWWASAVRTELAKPAYATAVANKDAAAAYAALTLPVKQTTGYVPIGSFQEPLYDANGKVQSWQPTTPAETATQVYLLAVFSQLIGAGIATSVSVARATPFLQKVVDLNFLSTADRDLALSVTPLQVMGVADVVTAPAKVSQAMGWGY